MVEPARGCEKMKIKLSPRYSILVEVAIAVIELPRGSIITHVCPNPAPAQGPCRTEPIAVRQSWRPAGAVLGDSGGRSWFLEQRRRRELAKTPTGGSAHPWKTSARTRL